MKKNVGNIDRAFRFILAALMASLYFTNTVSGTAGLVLVVLAVVFLLTSLVGFCPLYLPFGVNTCKNNKK